MVGSQVLFVLVATPSGGSTIQFPPQQYTYGEICKQLSSGGRQISCSKSIATRVAALRFSRPSVADAEKLLSSVLEVEFKKEGSGQIMVEAPSYTRRKEDALAKFDASFCDQVRGLANYSLNEWGGQMKVHSGLNFQDLQTKVRAQFAKEDSSPNPGKAYVQNLLLGSAPAPLALAQLSSLQTSRRLMNDPEILLDTASGVARDPNTPDWASKMISSAYSESSPSGGYLLSLYFDPGSSSAIFREGVLRVGTGAMLESVSLSVPDAPMGLSDTLDKPDSDRQQVARDRLVTISNLGDSTSVAMKLLSLSKQLNRELVAEVSPARDDSGSPRPYLDDFDKVSRDQERDDPSSAIHHVLGGFRPTPWLELHDDGSVLSAKNRMAFLDDEMEVPVDKIEGLLARPQDTSRSAISLDSLPWSLQKLSGKEIQELAHCAYGFSVQGTSGRFAFLKALETLPAATSDGVRGELESKGACQIKIEQFKPKDQDALLTDLRSTYPVQPAYNNRISEQIFTRDSLENTCLTLTLVKRDSGRSLFRFSDSIEITLDRCEGGSPADRTIAEAIFTKNGLFGQVGG